MPRKAAFPCSQAEQEQVKKLLHDWHQSMVSLHKNYTELTAYLTQSLSPKISLNQCPRKPVVKLIHRMQLELERLIQDMNLFDRPTSLYLIAKKLAAHSVIVARLNDQAQTRLYLIKQSVS